MSSNRINPLKQWMWPVIFIGPCLLGLLCFTYLPILASFSLSFCEWNLLGAPTWVGFANYQHLMTDPLFWKVLQTTVCFVGMLVTGELLIGLALALAIHRLGQLNLTLASCFRFIYFLPFITPMVSVALVWGWLYDPQGGLLNTAFLKLGLIQHPVAWLYTKETALIAIVALELWKMVGYYMVLFLAGLQGISESLEDAAKLDGANAWQRLVRITLPMLTPTLFFTLMIALIQGFQSFDSVYLLTQGGPEKSTATLVYWLFQNAFAFYRVGEASAMGYLLFILLATFTFIQWQLRKRWVLHEG